MKLSPIKTDEQYERYLEWVDEQFDLKVAPESEEGEQVQIALLLIKQWEDMHYPIASVDPIDAIKLRMKELGLRNKDLVNRNYGSKGHISLLLNRKKSLTIDLAKRFHKELKIPAQVFLK
jgi:HTH-type transcriptional regulator / antitoxin HigA